jgi:hypothetical protein
MTRNFLAQLGVVGGLMVAGASLAQAQILSDGYYEHRYEGSQVASQAAYVEVKSGALMIHQRPRVDAQGKAARIVGISRYGRKLYLLDEFRRGASHGIEVSFLTPSAAEEARVQIFQGASIDVSRCVQAGSVVASGPSDQAEGFGLSCRTVVRQPVFSCGVLVTTPVVRVQDSAYQLAPLSESLAPRSARECSPSVR